MYRLDVCQILQRLDACVGHTFVVLRSVRPFTTYGKRVAPNGKFKNGRYIAILRQTIDQVANSDV